MDISLIAKGLMPLPFLSGSMPPIAMSVAIDLNECQKGDIGTVLFRVMSTIGPRRFPVTIAYYKMK